MTITALQLINESLRVATLASRGFSSAQDSYVASGLFCLQQIIDDASIDTSMNPFYANVDFTTSLQKYTLTGAALVEAVRYNNGNIFPLLFVPRERFFDRFQPNTNLGQPAVYTYDQSLTGCIIEFSPAPDQAYVFTAQTKPILLPNVQRTTDLSLTFPGYYIKYLKYALAKNLCIDFSRDVPLWLDNEVRKSMNKIANRVSPPDTSIQKLSTLNSGLGLYASGYYGPYGGAY